MPRSFHEAGFQLHCAHNAHFNRCISAYCTSYTVTFKGICAYGTIHNASPTLCRLIHRKEKRLVIIIAMTFTCDIQPLVSSANKPTCSHIAILSRETRLYDYRRCAFSHLTIMPTAHYDNLFYYPKATLTRAYKW